MERLMLMGVDGEDLEVISAHVQDAVFKVGDIDYDAARRQLTLTGNRFAWERASGLLRRRYERRRAALAIKRAGHVRTRGIDRGRPDDVLSLLSLRFVPGDEPPAGVLELVFAGDATIAVEVECLEVQLADVGGAWETRFKPKHPLAR